MICRRPSQWGEDRIWLPCVIFLRGREWEGDKAFICLSLVSYSISVEGLRNLWHCNCLGFANWEQEEEEEKKGILRNLTVSVGSLPSGSRMVVSASSQVALVVKNLPASAGDARDAGSIPGWGRSPGEGNGSPLQNSCLENPMDRGAWRATVHGVTKSQT